MSEEKFPVRSDHQSYCDAVLRRYVQPVPVLPVSLEEIVDRLYVEISTCYRSGERDVRTGVRFDAAKLTGLDFEVPVLSSLNWMDLQRLRHRLQDAAEPLLQQKFDSLELSGWPEINQPVTVFQADVVVKVNEEFDPINYFKIPKPNI